MPALPHLAVLPATQDLVGAELQLVDAGRESALRTRSSRSWTTYDYIMVDCPPSLGLLTLNVLAAANSVLIPIQCEYYGLEGISQLPNTIRLVQQNFNPGLAISGVLLTMYDSRSISAARSPKTPRNTSRERFRNADPAECALAEAPSFGKPILLYDVQSVGAKSYFAVGQELIPASSPPRSMLDPAAEPPAAGGDDMTETKRLGRGLEALLGPISREKAEAAGALRELPVDSVTPESVSAADHIDEAAFTELAASIEASGLFQPVIVDRATAATS